MQGIRGERKEEMGVYEVSDIETVKLGGGKCPLFVGCYKEACPVDGCLVTDACALAGCGADGCLAAGCALAVCGGAGCGLDACPAAGCALDACAAAACGADACAAAACGLAGCAADACAIATCPLDVCSPDACAVDVTPLPGITPPGSGDIPMGFDGNGEETVVFLTGRDLDDTFDLLDEYAGE